MPEYTKLFPYTSKLREEDEKAEKELPNPRAHITHFNKLQSEATFYFLGLNDPRVLNWSDLTWIWY